MDSDLNLSIRKFLKQVGVTSQQAIEAALDRAGPGAAGPYRVSIVLRIDDLDLEHQVDGVIGGASE